MGLPGFTREGPEYLRSPVRPLFLRRGHAFRRGSNLVGALGPGEIDGHGPAGEDAEVARDVHGAAVGVGPAGANLVEVFLVGVDLRGDIFLPGLGLLALL